MSNQTAHIEDPEELNILRAINRGETRLETVDWKPYLSDIVKMIGLMNPPNFLYRLRVGTLTGNR